MFAWKACSCSGLCISPWNACQNDDVMPAASSGLDQCICLNMPKVQLRTHFVEESGSCEHGCSGSCCSCTPCYLAVLMLLTIQLLRTLYLQVITPFVQDGSTGVRAPASRSQRVEDGPLAVLVGIMYVCWYLRSSMPDVLLFHMTIFC